MNTTKRKMKRNEEKKEMYSINDFWKLGNVP